MFHRCFQLLLAGATLLLLNVVPSVHAAGAEPREITIGVILPLTGDMAALGEATKNGIMMALEELPLEDRRRIRVLYQDDALRPAQTVAAFESLLQSNRLDAVINISSGTALALAPVAERKQIPMIAIASNGKISAGRKWVVTLWVSPEAEVQVLVPEMKRRGYKKVAVITTAQEGFVAMRNAFSTLAAGFDVAYDEELPPDLRDFRTQITKIRGRQVDGIVSLLSYGQLGIFAKQAREQGLTVPLFGLETFEEPDEVAASGGALRGSWYVTSADPDSEFMARYKARYPTSSAVCAPNGYDALRLIVAGAKEPSGVMAYLRSVKDYRGALGSYSASGDNRFTLPAAVKIVP
jgi:branched-chain amino acid transport system substrate-binding protein